MQKLHQYQLLTVLSLITVSSVCAQAPTALLRVGTYAAMDPISKNDGMTPDHIPSGAAVVAACYLSDNGQAKLDAITRFTDLYESTSSPYRHVYLKANTIVYDTTIHQKASPTYGIKNAKDNSIKIRTDAKNLAKAFADDKAVVVKALLGQALDSQGNSILAQKTRDADNKPTTTPVTASQVEKAFKALDDANTSSGIYTVQGLKTFCKKLFLTKCSDYFISSRSMLTFCKNQ